MSVRLSARTRVIYSPEVANAEVVGSSEFVLEDRASGRDSTMPDI